MWIIIVVIVVIVAIIFFSKRENIDKEKQELILDALEHSKKESLTSMLNEWTLKINWKFHKWQTMLIMASMMWKPDMVKFLIEKWAKVNTKDNDWWVALSYAYASVLNRIVSSTTAKEVGEILLDNWANPNIKNRDWRTPLFFAIWIERKDILDDLDKHWVNWDVRDNRWFSPRMIRDYK